MALTTTFRQAVWYLNTFNQLGYTIPRTMIAGNTSSINVAENPINNPRTKHIDVAYHFTREHLMRKSFTLSYVLSNDNTADLMTKGLNSVAHHEHTQRLGLSEWEWVFRHAFCPLCCINTLVFHIVNPFVLAIYYDTISYVMSSSFYGILSVSSVVVQFIASHHTYAHKPVLILVICFTYLVSISHTVLFHITCVYSLPE